MNTIELKIPLSQIIEPNVREYIFSESQMVQFDVPNDEFIEAAEDVSQRLKIKLKNGLCSSVLINQLARHRLNIYEKFGDEIHSFHMPCILDTIELIEIGKSTNIRDFKRKPLNGYKHVHHNSRTHIQMNMLNIWKKMYRGQNEIELQNKLLNEIYKELIKEMPESKAQQRSLTVLLNRIHMKAISRPNNEATGEWIVFKTVNNINYYLCLATHAESDQDIYNRIMGCFPEFPELV